MAYLYILNKIIMAKNNFERMIQLAEDAFDARHDPEQLDVDETVLEKLYRLHPATRSEFADENGPVAWILVIPTTTELMQEFIENKINEKQLLDLTPPNTAYGCIYLCSAMVLDEYRHKGIAKRLTLEAIESIRETHMIKSLFVWPFSEPGLKLAQNIGSITGLKLYIKTT